MPNQDLRGCLTWPVIIIAFVFFWPLGLILLALRLKDDRALRMKMGNNGLLFVAGVAAAILFGMATLESFGRPGAHTLWFLALAIGGVVVAQKGWRLRQTASRSKRYIELIVNQQQPNVDAVAAAMGRPDITGVMAELRSVIDGGFLPGYTVDPVTRAIRRNLPPAPLTPVVVAAAMATRAAAPAAPSRIAFKCSGCGANNEMLAAGGSIRCEFCDRPYQAG